MFKVKFWGYFLLIVLFTAKGAVAQQTYNHIFNPNTGFVSETEKPFRAELCLNGKWQFMPVFEESMSKFVKPGHFDWDAVPLKVPSPWNVNSFAQGDGGDFLTFPSYPKAWEKAQMGWMRKDFVLPENWDRKQIRLHFEAIAGFAKIYVNGQLAGENLDIFFPTDLDITSLLKKGTNEILVGVAKASLTDVQGKYGRRNYVAGSFWGQHIAGIWQDVSLIAIPDVFISDVFVQPDVQNDQLSFAVTIINQSDKAQSLTVDASVRNWEKPVTNDVNLLPEANGVLKDEVLQFDKTKKISLNPGDTLVVNLSKKVNGNLKNWAPDSPNLYGAVISLNDRRKQIDRKFTRFGWRQFTIKGTDFLLNGKPIVMKGDSWHFMGIPQMTRRYAWGWFKMLKDANANAVRLHAQPYPSFYLDMADEMGICVLDETGIWSSDGRPKMDSDDYWIYCKKHVKSLVMRDRNHPSIFGWSVCNETIPVVVNVFHAPETIVQRQIQEINNWVKIVKNLDQTRDWISGDGDDMRPTDLPTVIGHYGDESSMKVWSSENKPWGVGETGMGYYGTPKQISAVNGDRAYESQQGRMDGLATEAYDLIGMQQKYKASYTSVFNIIWYGLKPLELGLKDTLRAPKPEDGIFFPTFQEGIPGVQPERLGPYSSTINPGYDINLPLYRPWPLFYAIQAINASPVKPFRIEITKPEEKNMASFETKITEMGWIARFDSRLKDRFSDLGVPFENGITDMNLSMIIIDGQAARSSQLSKYVIDKCLRNGGKVLVWGVSSESLSTLNELLPYPLELTKRNSTSFVKMASDPILANLTNKDFYFTENTRKPVMSFGLSGELVKHSQVLLDVCQTDWSRWNGQAEYLKTASVYRSERESKESGHALVKIKMNGGEIYLCSIDLFQLKADGEELIKKMLKNLGVELLPVPDKSRKALSVEATLERARIVNAADIQGRDPEKMDNVQFVLNFETQENQWKLIQGNVQGYIDFEKNGTDKASDTSEIYLSFWLNSPRSLVNLLVEPDMPQLDMEVEGSSGIALSINGVPFLTDAQSSNQKKLKNLPLDKGWNHILVKLKRNPDDQRWRTKIRFESNKPEFLKQLNSSVGQ